MDEKILKKTNRELKKDLSVLLFKFSILFVILSGICISFSKDAELVVSVFSFVISLIMLIISGCLIKFSGKN